MRTLVLAILTLSTTALANPRALPSRIAHAARDAFIAAQAADAKGDLQLAIKQYERANAIAPHPNTLYNYADTLARAKAIASAIYQFEQYLVLYPDSADRADVEARLVKLRALPGTLRVTYGEPDALLFVDGQPRGALGDKRTLEVTAGAHWMEAITPITYTGRICDVPATQDSSCDLGGPPRVDGNVVIGTSTRMGGLNWPVDGQRFETRGRFPARPGHYELTVMDRQCKPLPLEVPAGDVVVYAFITYPATEGRCIDLRIEQRTLAFRP